MKNRTLPQLLHRAKSLAGRGICFIEKSDQEDFLSYGDLYERALKGLSFLQDQGMQPADELVFQIDDNKTFIIVFWACILGGIIPVPLSVGQNDDHRQKLFNVWPVLNNPSLIISGEKSGKLGEFARQKGLEEAYAHVQDRSIDEAGLLAAGRYGQARTTDANDVAFVQFSSGSTGNPKGVMLTHRNLIANLEAISRAAAYTERDAMMSWMPLTHDMGLIGFHLNPLFVGMNHYLMPAGLFIRRPALWLDKATAHRATVLCSPNFGYQYLLRHCHAPEVHPWDLSRVRLLYNGAEPISGQLCRDFVRRLSDYGLPGGAMRPVYGLAEASLAVSISGLNDPLQELHLDRSRLNFGDRVSAVAEGPHSVSFVNVGRPVHHCLIRIADQANGPAGDETIGHVQIKGENVTAGYYNNAGETKNTITEDGWLKTGDLGLVKDGSLYVTGRVKDIIFKNGQNYYPHDIERVAQELDGIELNKVAVAGFFNPRTRREEAIAFVFHRGSLAAFVPVAQALGQHINRTIGFEMDRVLPVKDLPRTTSGKMQRFKLIEQYANGHFRGVEAELAGLPAQPDTGPAVVSDPGNENEQKLLGVWRRVLGNEALGVTERFFETGGNSLKAAELAMLLLKEFGYELPVELLHEKQTVRELAGEMAALRQGKYVPLPSARRRAHYPASSAQKRLYYAWEADRSSTAYNIPVAFRVSGPVELGRLTDCIAQLVRRHDTLRLTFRMGLEPEFSVHDPAHFTLVSESCHAGEADQKLKDFVRPFDLAKGPLFRVKLLKPGKGDCLLFMDFHHSISDGISVHHFIGELLQLYAGNPLPAATAGYREYVQWENQNPQPSQPHPQEAYWLDRLRGELPVLAMPLDFVRPALFCTAGEKIPFTLSRETTGRLRQLAARHHCTLHALLLALYKVLLARYSGQDDLIVGIAVAGRPHPDLLGMQGMFVNNLPVRSAIAGDQPFTAFLELENRGLAEALNHQHYPFEALVGRLCQKRDVSRNPVFDTMFVYQNVGMPAVPGAGFTLSPHFFDPGFAKFDLSLEVFEDGEALRCALEYATALFRRETALRLAAHFGNLVRSVLDNPGSNVADLSVLSPEEHDGFVRAYNSTQRPYPGHQTIHGLFEEQVAKTPGRVALVYDGETLTYRELDERAGHLATRLREQGMGRNGIAAVLLQRSPELIIAIFGILKAGGAYLPIDPDWPEARIAYLLSDSQCRVVVTGTSPAHDPAGVQPEGQSRPLPVIRVDRHDTSHPVLRPSGSASADLAYVIYTSGTTGQPKGVMIEHRSLVNYIHWAAEHYVRNEEAAFALFTSVSFDLTVTSIFTPLLTGNRIVIYGEAGKDLLLEQVIAGNQADVVKLTPSHLRMLREIEVDTARTRVKRFIVGGEQLETQLARQIHDKFGGKVEIYNEYGPTEATVGCMIHRYDPAETLARVPLGVPAANTQLYVLDQFLKPVPLGVSGELYIAGDGLARGYWAREELTLRQFISNPFAPGQRMYKTGDVARHLPAGVIEYLGRVDQQVKVNGYRIEPAEIERHLRSHPAVTEALVVLGRDQPHLYAYYQATEGIDEPALRRHLAARLPYYMIPARFVRIAAIPLTGNGKTDYAALPEPAGAAPAGRPPADATEALLLRVWQEVLGGKDLRVTDNFFELGGDSIKAVQIASRLFEQGVALPVKDILTYGSVAEIRLHAAITGAAGDSPQGIVAGEKGLSPIEHWFFGQHFAHPEYHNQSVLLALNKKADVGRLAETFKRLVEHHDGLRMNYDPGKRVMFYNNQCLAADFVVEEIALMPSPEARLQPAPNAAALEAACTRLKTGFDLANGLLLKAALIREAGGGELLFITAHHLVTDGVSWRILLEDLLNVYNALESGETVRLPRKTATLLDWEKETGRYWEAGGPRAEAAYWHETTGTAFVIPQDFDDEAWQVRDRRTVTGLYPKEKTDFLLKEAHHAYKTDVPILLNTALALTLKEWTSLDTFVIEQENHGRHLDAVNTARTVGWFTAMYPVKLQLKDDLIGNGIKAVKEQLRNVPNQGIGYGMYPLFGLPHAGSPAPLRFNYLGQFDHEFDNALFTYSRRLHGSDVHPDNRMTARLELNAMIAGGELSLEVHYNRRAHRASTIDWFTGTFFAKLSAVLEHVRSEDEIHFTASDFNAAGLNDEDLMALFG